MNKLLALLFGVFLVNYPAFCGLAGYTPLGALLGQADQVVVATVRDSAAAGNTLTLDLIVIRALKGSGNVGTAIPAMFASPNVIPPTSSGPLRMNGAILATELVGTTGLWFLQQSGTGWVVLPLMTGDILTDGLYLPIPTGDLPSAFIYNTGAVPRTKLALEIGAAAQNPTTAAAISRLEGMRVFVDLGSDLLPILGQLTAAPQITTMATGLAGQIRLGIPAALNAVANSNLGTFPPDAQGRLADAVCEYRNADAGGIAALGAFLGSQYADNMRTCAAYALREIHSPQTLPFLATLLGDSSAQIRYDAVIGIAQFAMSFPVASYGGKPAVMATFTPPANVTDDMRQHYPAQGLFLANEQEYISYWKTWLAAHPAN